MAPAPPPAPPPPNWPANQPPNPATVTWDSRGLHIEASNSSLDQILHEVAADTGAKLQGLSEDQRVFGSYGPGPAREVLSKLLEGTGYNVFMVGEQGPDAPPQEIILSRSQGGTPVPANATQAPQNNEDENDSYEQQEQQPSNQQQFPRPPGRNPFGSGGPPRTPQEVQQEILMRQQQMEQQREQQEQQNPQ